MITNNFKLMKCIQISNHRHSPKDNNDKVFEDVIRIPTNQLFEGYSSMIFFLGGPKSGKTYTVAGKMHQSNKYFN